MSKLYQPTWNSLRQHPNPQWLQDVKFGIYTHREKAIRKQNMRFMMALHHAENWWFFSPLAQTIRYFRSPLFWG